MGCLGLWQEYGRSRSSTKDQRTKDRPTNQPSKVGVPLVVKATLHCRFAFYMHIQQRGSNKANLPTVIVACTVVWRQSACRKQESVIRKQEALVAGPDIHGPGCWRGRELLEKLLENRNLWHLPLVLRGHPMHTIYGKITLFNVPLGTVIFILAWCILDQPSDQWLPVLLAEDATEAT